MPRHSMINNEQVAFTTAEETARDAEEATWESQALARASAELRTKRDALLVSSDWTQAADSPLTNEAKASWTTYRQELRDLPANTADPAAPVWPVL